MKRALFFAATTMLAVANATVFYKESFDAGWESRWVSNTKKENLGKFEVTTGAFYGDAEADKGLTTTQDARFYFTSSKLATPFSNVGKPMVLQFSVKHGQDIDCGGGYIKVLPAGLDQADFNGDSKYNIMFGPDICGSTKKVHVIFNHNDKNHLIKKEIRCESDAHTHVYTLIVNPDQTYEVRVDGAKKEGGKLEDDWNFLAPRTIKDPNSVKPADWVDDEMIDDPEDKKPEGYDDIAKQIPDPNAEKPADWDTAADGEWEAPKIDNPAYKGPWKAKRVKNPAYKGKWEQSMIPNPEFKEDNTLGQFESNAFVGFDLWQVKSGSIFDNIILTDDIKEAEQLMKDTFSKNIDAEKKMKSDQLVAKQNAEAEKKKAEEEAKKLQEEEKKKTEASKNPDDDDDDDDAPKEQKKDEL